MPTAHDVLRCFRPARYALLLALPSLPAQAHSFGRLYTLPMPFWLYAWSASAVLLLSFLAAALLWRQPSAPATRHRPTGRTIPGSTAGLTLLRLFALAALLLCIATGLWGPHDAYANVNMTLFWIGFVLVGTWASALIGDWYALINPWQTLSRCIGHYWPRYRQGLWRYPARLGVWPALTLYAAFIWIELLGQIQPHGLALLLIAYTAVNLVGAGLVGTDDWFRHCEFFSVLLSLLALMAPVVITQQGRALQVRFRPPFSALLTTPASRPGEVPLVLFMLASTAFDGFRETATFVGWYWTDFYHWAQPWLGQNPFAAYPRLFAGYPRWQTAALLLTALLYVAVYRGFVAFSKFACGSPAAHREWARLFVYSLLPIALVYHVSHYWTLLLTQGLSLFPQLSDPFGTGADYLGTRGWFNAAVIPDLVTVWHVQVGLIVLGHIVSVVVAHGIAMQHLGNARRASLSQWPMLALMVALTVAGLWILAQPLKPAGF